MVEDGKGGVKEKRIIKDKKGGRRISNDDLIKDKKKG